MEGLHHAAPGFTHPRRLAICVGLGLCFKKGDPENNRDFQILNGPCSICGKADGSKAQKKLHPYLYDKGDFFD